MTAALSGVFPVFQTPFLEDETIDGRTLGAEIDWMYSHGIDGIVMAMVSSAPEKLCQLSPSVSLKVPL